jgi:chromosome segregation ATPase
VIALFAVSVAGLLLYSSLNSQKALRERLMASETRVASLTEMYDQQLQTIERLQTDNTTLNRRVNVLRETNKAFQESLQRIEVLAAQVGAERDSLRRQLNRQPVQRRRDPVRPTDTAPPSPETTTTTTGTSAASPPGE